MFLRKKRKKLGYAGYNPSMMGRKKALEYLTVESSIIRFKRLIDRHKPTACLNGQLSE